MSTDLSWFKSSYSGDQGGDCVEVAVSWVKSSYSSDYTGNCVEIATCADSVHVRDSKDLAVASLSVSPSAWAAFLSSMGA
ncbi:DUF397 domain-containing protein [Streptomyces exfoliatus]|uniref:DUF397 domain-containing protein n=1 Tax=Streptomyces exfoliatus TaxID=1905 RepID=UPI000464BF68|nr:DUF397 domain-containing protein [Streptomyces exfoliatus]